jgi:hypothetical protein
MSSNASWLCVNQTFLHLLRPLIHAAAALADAGQCKGAPTPTRTGLVWRAGVRTSPVLVIDVQVERRAYPFTPGTRASNPSYFASALSRVSR